MYIDIRELLRIMSIILYRNNMDYLYASEIILQTTNFKHLNNDK